ncbi:MAG: hypothetical protein EOP56_14915 [Sphingobacteriales bacterium]|nr:MAG: hypothetical protein EOP56_14915 [Sphingobacteriales bacterium]
MAAKKEKERVRFSLEKDKYIYISYYADDKRVRGSIGEAVDKTQFEKGEDELPKKVRTKMNRIRLAINEYEERCRIANKEVYKSDIETIIQECGVSIKERAKSKEIVKDAFRTYAGMIKSGAILNRGKPFKESTSKHLAALQAILDVVPFGQKRIDDLRWTDFAALHQYFLETKHENDVNNPQGYKQNTFSTYNSYIITFLRRTAKSDTGLGWHNNRIYERSDLRVPPEDIDTHIYLTPEEIEKLYNTQVNPLARETLDAFCFGCCVGLRHSDIRAGLTEIINYTVHKTTQKGGNAVIIPLNRLAREIYDKYGRIPKIGLKPVNTLQGIAQKAGLDYKCLYSHTESGKKVAGYFPKYELIGTHTMRRSFATNAFKAGVPAISIMKITGHKTESSFMKYIRISNEENAELMRHHEFFK